MYFLKDHQNYHFQIQLQIDVWKDAILKSEKFMVKI